MLEGRNPSKLTLKRMILFVIIALVIIFAGWIMAIRLALSGWSDGIVKEGKEIIKTNIGDEFLVQYSTTNFPDYETRVKIYDVSKKNSLGYYVIQNGDYIKPKVEVQIDAKDMRCYKVAEKTLIYKVNNGGLKGATISFIGDEKLEGNDELVVLSKRLIAKKEWYWIKYCGKFLLKAGDNEVKETLERYAFGQFTEEELDINRNSDISKEDMKFAAKQILQLK